MTLKMPRARSGNVPGWPPGYDPVNECFWVQDGPGAHPGGYEGHVTQHALPDASAMTQIVQRRVLRAREIIARAAGGSPAGFGFVACWKQDLLDATFALDIALCNLRAPAPPPVSTTFWLGADG